MNQYNISTPELFDPDWKKYLAQEFNKNYYANLQSFLNNEISKNRIIYPESKNVFNAFLYTPLNKTKVVIIGQDPYHGPNQAHGLCFSVQENIKVPPSLKNIYKELQMDIDFTIPSHGYLRPWAHSGVLMLNSVLTVQEGNPGSHHGQGWEIFTDKIIEILNEEKENLVFLLWGSPAQKKANKVDSSKHLILKSPHPSPLSAYRGFFGCSHFSKANEYLIKNGVDAIDWSIS